MAPTNTATATSTPRGSGHGARHVTPSGTPSAQSSPRHDGNGASSSSNGSNPTKDSFHLLDLLGVVKETSTALKEFKSTHGEGMKASAIRRLEVIVESLDWVHFLGFRQVGKISRVKHLQKSYAFVKAAERKRKADDPMQTTRSGTLFELKTFNKRCKTRQKEETRPPPPPPEFLFYDDSRRSARSSSPPTLESRLSEFTGLPPQGANQWTKETLCLFIDNLVDSNMPPRRFLEKIVEKKKSVVATVSGLYRLHKRWKSTGRVRSVGRPPVMELKEISAAARKQLRDCTNESNTFRLKDMKQMIVSQKKKVAESNGLDPDSVECSISSQWAKVNMIATSATENGVAFSQKKLLKKTASRFRSEHSLMSGLSYACTALTTMYLSGPQPAWMGDINMNARSSSTLDTVDMVKKLLDCDTVYPVNPNLVLSTDDTTLFVFEGTTNETGEEEWDWKLIDMSNSSSVRSDFEVGSDVENSGGLRVRLTFTFTAAGLAAPPYVSVSGLTEDELSPQLCPDGILAAKVKKLCKGGNDLHNKGWGWLVFLRADKNRLPAEGDERRLSIANKKFIHYNDDVLLPFIQSIREEFGWKPGQEIPEWLTAVSWFDGDIPQLQTMVYEAREALDVAESIIRNKHAAAATGTQQPCDLSPVFRLLKFVQKRSTATNDTCVGLNNILHNLFKFDLRARGLNLDGNQRKKKALIDFLLCLPEMLEKVMTKDLLRMAFVEAGLIDEETKHFPNFDRLMGTCKRWVSGSKDIGVSMDTKRHCKAQFHELGKIQMDVGQISYSDMRAAGIPLDINERGEVIEEDRPCGADAEHRQGAKTINAECQKRKRAEKRARELARKANEVEIDRNIICKILEANKKVEVHLKSKTESGLLEDASVSLFLLLSIEQLKYFIHARKFAGKKFLATKLTPSGKTLKKTCYRAQTAESIETDCDASNPCLVWLAWSLREADLVLKLPNGPEVSGSLQVPHFEITYATPANDKCPSEYLKNSVWVDSFKATIKGVGFADIDDKMVDRAKYLVLAMRQRLDNHIANFVDKRRHQHYTLDLFRDNIPALAAGKCLVGHIVDQVESFRLDECLLVLPEDGDFRPIQKEDDSELGSLEGDYLHFDQAKKKWIRSGKAAGLGKDACFIGRGNKHDKNARMIAQMIDRRLYREYPARGVENIGGNMGKYWDNLQVYCGMAFDRRADVTPLCSTDGEKSVYIWSKQIMDELKKRDGNSQDNQLVAVAYMWELCDELLLAKADNVSTSAGFESLGLTINN